MKQLRGIDLKRFLKSVPKHTKDVVLLLENIQYARNVATLFRTADAARINKIVLTGISQKPPFGKDLRKASRQKEQSVKWEFEETTGKAITKLKKQGYEIVALEITDEAKLYNEVNYSDKVCLLVGNETYGVTPATLTKVDRAVFIPMYGKGASLNVSTATGIALFQIIAGK